MVTKNAIDTGIPVEVLHGGTGRTSWAGSTTDGILKCDGSQLLTSSLVTIDADSVILNPQQPAFFAYKDSTTANATGNGTVFPVVFNVEAYDIGSNYNTGTGIFTAPKTGTYSFSSSVFSNNAGGYARSTMSILFKYNSTTVAQQDHYWNNTASTMHVWRTIEYNMSAGDTMSISAVISGAGAKASNIFGAIAIQMFTYFSGHLIG